MLKLYRFANEVFCNYEHSFPNEHHLTEDTIIGYFAFVNEIYEMRFHIVRIILKLLENNLKIVQII